MASIGEDIFQVKGWEMAKWRDEHEVPRDVTPMDWLENFQSIVAALPLTPTPLPEIYERIAALTALGFMTLAELGDPRRIEGLDCYRELFDRLRRAIGNGKALTDPGTTKATSCVMVRDGFS